MAGTNIPPERHYPDDIGEQQVYWLLTLTFGGEVIRLSTDTHDIDDAQTGLRYSYWGGLGNLRYSEPATFPQDVSEGVSVATSALMPEHISIAEMEARGHRLEGSRAELARWVRGSDFGSRRIIAVGEVADPIWGADAEPVSFSGESLVYRDVALIPTENQRVSAETWSTVDTLDPEEEGLYYPMIFGRPGVVSTGVNERGWITGSQGCWVDRTTSNSSAVGSYEEDLRLVIAGHAVAADRVYLQTSADFERFVVLQGVDSRGQIVSYIDATVNGEASPTSVGDFFPTAPDGNYSHGLGFYALDPSFQPGPAGNSYSTVQGVAPVYCGWLNDSGTGGEGGMIGPSGSLTRNALEIVEILLGYTRRPIDHGRFAAIRPLAAGFNLDFCIDAQTQPWPFIRDEILKLLPVSIVISFDGKLAPIWWRFDATAADAVAHINAGANPYIQRASGVRVDSSDMKNDFTIKYAYSIRKQTYYATRRLGAGPYDSDDQNTRVSLACKISQQRYRYGDGTSRISEDKLETTLVYDDATASAILSWRAACYALGRKKISYVVPERDYGWLKRGSVVTLSDPDLFIKEWVCLVTDIQLDDSRLMGLELLRVEISARDGVRFG